LYPEEQLFGNDFEIDVDVWLPEVKPWYFADYTLIRKIVAEVFEHKEELIETCVQKIHTALKIQFPVAPRIRVVVKKLHPPMPGDVAYSMVSYEA
jgi:dihydroneopterin aldolase